MQVLLERDRYETIMENLNPATNNPVDDRAIDNEIDDGATGASAANSAATECHPSKMIVSTTATNAFGAAADDSRGSSKRNVRDDDDRGATSPTKRVCSNSLKCSMPITRTRHFSKMRKVGHRCFFRWPGNTPLYHSGVIVGTQASGNEKVFIVSIWLLYSFFLLRCLIFGLVWFQIQAEHNNSPTKFKISSQLVFSESKYMSFEHQLPPSERTEKETTLSECNTVDLEPCVPDDPVVAPDFVGSGGAGPFKSPDTMPVRTAYSTSKILGARCYARWQVNGKYYWGYIQQVTGHGLTRRYSVSVL
jgi:hypothetical protein